MSPDIALNPSGNGALGKRAGLRGGAGNLGEYANRSDSRARWCLVQMAKGTGKLSHLER